MQVQQNWQLQRINLKLLEVMESSMGSNVWNTGHDPTILIIWQRAY
jgi:hypothetical protein